MFLNVFLYVDVYCVPPRCEYAPPHAKSWLRLALSLSSSAGLESTAEIALGQ